MPYIKHKSRTELEPTITSLIFTLRELEHEDPEANIEGCVNYIFSTILATMYPGTSYRNINDAMGILSSAQAEYYRKVAAPLENQKEFENGPVYDQAQ
jgi:hypothetical protein